MVKWNEVKIEFNVIKIEFDRIYKYLNKKLRVSENTFEKHKINITVEYNKLVEVYSYYTKTLTFEHNIELERELFVIRDRLLNLFTRLKLDISVPHSIKDKINLENQDPNFNESLLFDLDSDEELFEEEILNKEDLKMAQTQTDLLRVAAQTINKVYSGDYLGLNSFINSVEVIEKKAIAENADFLKAFILSRLDSKALEAVPDEPASIKVIKDSLKANIHPDNSKVIEGRMKALRLDNMSYQDFAKVAEEVADSYKRSLISEGISKQKSKELSIERTVELCKSTARSSLIKTVIAATTFQDTKDVIALFLVELGNEKSEGTILHYNRNNFNNKNFSRGRGFRNNGYHNNSYNNHQNSNN